MRFYNIQIPHAWIEIMDITEHNGNPLPSKNWRKQLIGKQTCCIMAGSPVQPHLFFDGLFERKENDFFCDFSYIGNTSRASLPQESSEVPGVFFMKTQTCIYQFRILNETESAVLQKDIQNFLSAQFGIKEKDNTTLGMKPMYS